MDEITDEETLSLLQLAVHTPEVARNVMYPVFFAVGALLLAAVAIFIYHRLVLSVLFALGLSIFIFLQNGKFKQQRGLWNGLTIFGSTIDINPLLYP